MTEALMSAIFNGNSLTLVFVVGGFVWLAYNHLAHIQITLKEVSEGLKEVREDVAYLKGKLGEEE